MSKHKKNKRARLSSTSSSASKSRLANRDSKERHTPHNATKSKTIASKKQHKQIHPVLQPFDRRSDVLLVGEGDFSFARALSNGIPIHLHSSDARSRRGCVDGAVGNEGDNSASTEIEIRTIQVRTITATSLDSAEEVRRKYPTVVDWLDDIDRCRGEASSEHCSVDLNQQENGDVEDEFEGFSPSHSPTSSPIPRSPTIFQHPQKHDKHLNRPPIQIHHAIDATHLHTYKAFRHPPSLGSPQTSTQQPAPVRKEAPKGFTHVVFNFPHVGGLSTDRSRQIRANQLLLVDFFKSAKQLLRPAGSRRQPSAERKPWEEAVSDNEEFADEDSEGAEETEPDGGRVIISLFEGDPYDSWDVRALAKSAGFEVERSGRFAWELWGGMGYAHARTLGVLRAKNEREGGGSSGSAAGNGDGERGDDLSAPKEIQIDGEDELMEETESNSKQRPKKRKDGWKGEQRPARMYVFKLRNPEQMANQVGMGTKKEKEKKRRRGQDSESD